MYHHINPDSGSIKELEEVGVDLVIEIIGMFQSQYKDDCKQIGDAISKNDFERISRNGHSIGRMFAMFLSNDHPAAKQLYEFETSARTKSYEHRNNDFVKNDVDFKKLFTEIKKLLKEPLAEINILGEEYKNGLRP